MNSLTSKKPMLTRALVALVMVAAVFALMSINPDIASANAWEKAGITPDGDVESSGVYDDLSSLVTIVIVFGGFWVLLCLIFAGMKLSSSQGNPQNRTAGMIGLAFAAVGGLVIYKAYDLAGWIAGFGA
ncbi:hypothetical protein [Terribacillus sp. DMT04]|uniref:hypothetical protein n=1 Tax=Terribacillus TaxID=459532 RepID=UPI0020B82ABA|nr:hypothetical protein [Terribacillus sp. DMT04]